MVNLEANFSEQVIPSFPESEKVKNPNSERQFIIDLSGTWKVSYKPRLINIQHL